MAEHTHSDQHHGPSYYVKIWGILLVLLIISIVGPELGNRYLTLITAFGIAIIKAVMVAAYFMHLKVEKKYISYMLLAMLLMVAMFFFGTAGDTMKPDGQNWRNEAAHKLIEQHKAMPTEGHKP